MLYLVVAIVHVLLLINIAMVNEHNQPVLIYSKLTTEALAQGVKYVQN